MSNDFDRDFDYDPAFDPDLNREFLPGFRMTPAEAIRRPTLPSLARLLRLGLGANDSYRDAPGFAIAAGIAAPLACFAPDAIMRLSGGSDLLIRRNWVPAYAFVIFEMLLMAASLAARGRLGAWSGVVGGFLFVGAMVAAGIGTLLLPFSLLGLIILIGVLGFVPFLTAYAFAGQALLAVKAARARASRWVVMAAFALGAGLACGLPIVLHVVIHRQWQAAVDAVAGGDASAWSRAEFWSRLVDPDEKSAFDLAIDEEPDPVRRERLIEFREARDGPRSLAGRPPE